MKLTFKNVFLSVGVLAFALLLVVSLPTNKVEANTCTAVSDGDWHTVARWSGCGGVLPQATDDVVIPDNYELTMSGSSSIASLTIQNAATTANGLTIGTGNTLTVTGSVSLAASAGAASTLAIGGGTLTLGTNGTGDLTIAGDGTNDSAVTLTAGGTLTVGDDIVFSGTAGHAKLTSTGATNINLGGDMLPAAGTVTRGSSVLTLNGSAAQSLGVSTTAYYDLVIANTSAVASVTTTGQVTVNHNLTISDGTFDPGSQQLDVTGTTTIGNGGILLISSTNANKTFTGAVTVQSGGNLTETAAATLAFGDDLSINSGGTMTETGAAVTSIAGSLAVGGTYTAGTGTHTFSGTSKSITGAVTIPSVSITGTYTYPSANTFTVATLLTIAGSLTNTGTVTASTALEGAGDFINGAGGVLNIGGTFTTTNFNATSDTNTVNYTKDGAQTVKDGTNHEYGHLGLSGSGAKTITAATLIAGNLTIGGTATATLSGDSNTANKLYFGTSLQRAGTHGATAASATYETNTYFTTGATGLVTVATGRSGNSGNSGSGGSSVVTCGPLYTLKNGECVAKETTPATPATPATDDEPATPATPASPATLCPNGKTMASNCTLAPTTNPGVGHAYAFGQTLVKQGTKGEACKAWQTFFNEKFGAKLAVDGNCGKLTIATAKAWQKSVGLVADGLLGKMSRTKASAQ
jgi:hypothetical protein